MSNLDSDDPRSPYEQFADAQRERIRSGEVPAGGQLPSYHALSEEVGLAPNTVKRALAVLRNEGLVVSRQGKGLFVRTQPPGDGDQPGRTIDDVWRALVAANRRLDELEQRLPSDGSPGG